MTYKLFIFLSLLTAISLAGCKGPENGNTNTNPQSAPVETAVTYSTANDALTAGNKFLDNGETVKAIAAYEQATAMDPDLADAFFQLGIAYALYDAVDDSPEAGPDEVTTIKNGKQVKENKTRSTVAFEKAVEAYKKRIKANEDDDVAYFDLGRAYNKLNEDDDALKALLKATKLKPDDTEYLTELGAIQIKLAKYHEAVITLKKTLDIDAENVEAQELLDKAEAGSKRVDYAQPKTTATTIPRTSADQMTTRTETRCVQRKHQSAKGTKTVPSPTPRREPTPVRPAVRPTPKIRHRCRETTHLMRILCQLDISCRASQIILSATILAMYGHNDRKGDYV